MTATISGSAVSTLVALTTTGNTILGDASTDTLNVGNGGLVKDASGNVGIGTASPDALLTLNKASGAADIRFKIGGTLYGNMYASASDFTINSVTAIPLTFGTNSTERMRIDSSGNLLVGTTSNPNSCKFVVSAINSMDATVTVNTGSCYTGNYTAASGTVYYGNWLYNGSGVGYISSTGTTTVYATSSDYRLKEAIAPMVGALATVLALKPVTYKWKSDGSDGQGFIAHELQAVVPDCVHGEKDAVNEDGSIRPQGIDTSFLVATLTAAIQEQQALITSLTTRLTALENK